MVWLAFGKELFGAIAFDLPLNAVTGTYRSLPSALLRAASELGITVIESLGTLAFIPDQLRFGVDHFLSLAQRFPRECSASTLIGLPHGPDEYRGVRRPRGT